MTPGFNFTPDVRAALHGARLEAARLHADMVDAEHVLLGILTVPDCTAVTIITSLGVSVEHLQTTIETRLGPAPKDPTVAVELPYTLRAKKVLEFSMAAAREMESTYIGTAHLLLGLMKEGRGTAATALTQVKLDTRKVTDEIRRRQRTSEDGPARATQSAAVTHSYRVNVPLLAEADAEARALGHDWVGPEHLFLAVASNADPGPQMFLERSGLSSVSLRQAVVDLVGPMGPPIPAGVPLTLGLRTTLAIGAAIREDKRRGNQDGAYSQVDLLNALFSNEVATPALVGGMLERCGVSLAAAREQLALLMGPTA